MPMVVCQSCGTKWKAPERLTGGSFRCRKCKAVVKVPSLGVQAETPPVLLDDLEDAPPLDRARKGSHQLTGNDGNPADDDDWERRRRERSLQVEDPVLEERGGREAPAQPRGVLAPWASWCLGGKLVFFASCLALLSLFLNWAELGIFTSNGFSQGTYLLLVLFIYPLLVLFQGWPMIRWGGVSCAVLGIVAAIAYFASKQVVLFEQSINAAGPGPVVFGLACLGLLIGVILQGTPDKNGVDRGAKADAIDGRYECRECGSRRGTSPEMGGKHPRCRGCKAVGAVPLGSAEKGNPNIVLLALLGVAGASLAMMVAVGVAGWVLVRWAQPNRQSVSTPSTVRKDGESGKEATSDSENWTDKQVRVGVIRARVGLVDLQTPTGPTKSGRPYLVINLLVLNTSQTQKFDFAGWGASPSRLFSQNTPHLSDNFGNKYEPIRFRVGTAVPGQPIDAVSVPPGDSVKDVLVFQEPVPNVQTLCLELPCSAFGGRGADLKLSISGTMIRRDQSPFSSPDATPRQAPEPADEDTKPAGASDETLASLRQMLASRRTAWEQNIRQRGPNAQLQAKAIDSDYLKQINQIPEVPVIRNLWQRRAPGAAFDDHLIDAIQAWLTGQPGAIPGQVSDMPLYQVVNRLRRGLGP